MSLAPGESKVVSASWKPTATRSHVITAVADPGNTLGEANELDNKVSVTITR